MTKINLLYVITKLELGGAQKQLLSLIRGLDKKKYNVFLFTAKDGFLVSEASEIDGLTIRMSRFLGRLINPLKDILALIEIYFFIKEKQIQVVHTHSSKAGILGRIAAGVAKAPITVHTVHGWSFNDFQPAAVNCFYAFLERVCAVFTNKIIVVSRFDQDKGLRRSIGKKEQYILIRYGIDLQSFRAQDKRNEVRKLLGLGDSDLVVGMVACFKPQKSPLDFIELAGLVKKDFPDIKFILVGDGQLRKKIDLRIKELELKDRVILTGWRDDIRLILSGLDAFVLTSLWEGLPIVVLEAMAASVVVVATDTGGIKEILTDGKTGYLTKPGDILSMRNRLEELLNNNQRKDEFIRQANKDIDTEEFLLSNMIKKTADLYTDLLKRDRNV